MIEKPKFTVTFELFGKKFRTVVPAEDKAEAKGKVRNAIKFLSVEDGMVPKKEYDLNDKPIKDIKDFFDGIFN